MARCAGVRRSRRPGQFRPGIERFRPGSDRTRKCHTPPLGAHPVHRRGHQHDLTDQRQLGADTTSERHTMALRRLGSHRPDPCRRTRSGAAGPLGRRTPRPAAPSTRISDPDRGPVADAAPSPAHRSLWPLHHFTQRHGRWPARWPVQHCRPAHCISSLPATVDTVRDPLDPDYHFPDQHGGAHHLADCAW